MTEPGRTASVGATPAAPHTQAAHVRRRSGSPDRITVVLISLTAFLLVLALLGTQLDHAGGGHVQHRMLLLRRIYRTTVVERVLPAGSGPRDGSSVTQSSSASGAEAPAPAAPVTRVS